eukprot:4176276-Pleurochrysis_carterae.AAC.2
MSATAEPPVVCPPCPPPQRARKGASPPLLPIRRLSSQELDGGGELNVGRQNGLRQFRHLPLHLSTRASSTTSSTRLWIREYRLWRAMATDAGTVPSAGRQPVYFMLENMAAHVASPHSGVCTSRDIAVTADSAAAVVARGASSCSVSSVQRGLQHRRIGRAACRRAGVCFQCGELRRRARRQVAQRPHCAPLRRVRVPGASAPAWLRRSRRAGPLARGHEHH